MKHFVLSAAHTLGVVHAARFLHKNALTILLYHGVAPKESSGPSARADGTSIYNYRGKFIEPQHFERQMHHCVKHYTILELDEAIQKLRAGTLPPYALAITFDDGYRNLYTHAYPVLKELNIPATMFVTTDFVCEKKPLWVDRLEYAMGHASGTREEKISRDARIRDDLKKIPEREREARLRMVEREADVVFKDFADDRAVYAPLSEDEIREMQESGITFGAHTKSHPILSRESPDRVEEEIAGSKDALEKICRPLSRVFAYPNGNRGDWSEKTEALLERHGFIAALTTVEGVNTRETPLMQMRRMVMDGTDSSTFASVATGVRSFGKQLVGR